MSFSKAPTEEMEQWFAEYKIAKLEYSAACKRIAELRIRSEYPNASDTDLAAYARARAAHKQECKDYAKARALFQSRIRASNTRSENLGLMRDRDEFERFNHISLQQLEEQRKQELIRVEVDSGKYNDVIEEFKKMQSAKEQFLSSPDHSFEKDEENPFGPV